MRKTLVIGEKELRIKASMGVLRAYRAQFGSDMIQDLNALYEATHYDPFQEAIKKTNIIPAKMTEEEIQSAILANVDLTKINETPLIDEQTTVKTLQCLWAMSCTSESYDKWAEDYDEILPVKEIIAALNNVWTEAGKVTVELKN